MSAPPNYFADLLGNAMDWIASQPEIRQLGHGTGLAMDLAKNAPISTAYSVPHYEHEVEPKKNA